MSDWFLYSESSELSLDLFSDSRTLDADSLNCCCTSLSEYMRAYFCELHALPRPLARLRTAISSSVSSPLSCLLAVGVRLGFMRRSSISDIPV